MKTNDVKKELDRYIALDKPNYAVEITGDWGTGKTFFIQDYIHEFPGRHRHYLLGILAKRVLKSKNKKGHKLLAKWLLFHWKKYIIYVPLYGIQDSKEIEKMIWVAALKCSFLKKIIDVFIACIVGVVFFLALKGIFDDKEGTLIDVLGIICTVVLFLAVWLYNTFKPSILNRLLKNIVIVFDDFERAEMSRKQLLAYINRYVEHLNRHVIIVCNEKEINKKRKNKEGESSFKAIQEKVIGKRLMITQEKDSSLETIFNQNTFSLLTKIVNIGNGAKEFFFSNSTSSKIPVNYRVWTRCCREFESTFENVPSRYLINPRVFKRLLHPFFSLRYALHIYDFGEQGCFSSKDANDFLFPHEIDNSFDWFNHIFDWKEEDRDILPDSTWKQIINGELINQQEVIEHWDLLLEKNQPLWLQLYKYLEKTDEEMRLLWKQLRRSFLSRSIHDLAQIISIVSSIFDMITSKCCPDSRVTPDLVMKMSEKYVSRIVLDPTVDFNRDETHLFDACETYGHHRKESDEFKRFRNRFRSYMKHYFYKCVVPANYDIFLSVIDKDEEIFDSYWYEHGLRYKPIFDGRPSEPLLGKLISLSPKLMRNRLIAIQDHFSSILNNDNKELLLFEKQFKDDIRKLLTDKNVNMDCSKRYWLEKAIIFFAKDIQSRQKHLHS